MLPLLEEAYIKTGKVKFVYKEYPVVNGDLSVIASLSAQCAGAQDQFWAMNDWLFSNGDVWKTQDSAEKVITKMKEAATAIGLDAAAFGKCFDEQALIQQVVDDYREGQTFGIRGTPNFVINGHWLQGLLPPEEFSRIIDALIEEAKTGNLPANVVTVTPSPTPDTDFSAEDHPARGDANASVTIVEFSDYQCPFCLTHFQQTMPQLLKDYIDTGKVKYVFMDFPLDSIHPQARKAAEAAECAGAQDKYWEMHDKLFGDQATWNGNDKAVDVFKKYAADLKLDATAFDKCLDEGKFAAEVEADEQEGLAAGVTGTPAFFINGRYLSGAQPFEVFQQIIDSLLAQ